MRLCLLAVAILAAGAPAYALDLTPKFEIEGRWFYAAKEAPVIGSAAATLELFQDWDNEHKRLVGEFFGRYDDNDPARTHADVRELYYQEIGLDFEFRLGARRVYWGVTESRHLVDIINQTDFVEDIDGESKLGQPMMNLALIRDSGALDLFLMPYQRARTFPGEQGYPRLPFPVHAHEAMYESDQAQTHLDTALRYGNTLGPLDFGLAYFNGTARAPRLLPCLRRGASGQYVQGSPDGPNCDIQSGILIPGSPFPGEVLPLAQATGLAPSNNEVEQEIIEDVRRNLVLVPYYDRLSQISLDAQVVSGALAVKLEALRRVQQDRITYAAVTGFEYTLGNVWETGADIGLLAEYLYDQQDDLLGTLFDDELFLAGRLFLSDTANTQLLAGVIASREEFENRIYGIELSRSLADGWRLALEGRVFSRIPRDTAAQFLNDQDFLTVTLERFF